MSSEEIVNLAVVVNMFFRIYFQIHFWIRFWNWFQRYFTMQLPATKTTVVVIY